MPNKALRRLVEGAVIAALYTALTLALAPISFGPFQCPGMGMAAEAGHRAQRWNNQTKRRKY